VWAHLGLTLRLNFRARQALVYGYVVPVFFLLAYGSVFHSSVPPLLHEMGQLVTITILGGACFGMPTAMVSERERGVWRRYRLLPGSTAGLIVSAMVARYVIVLLAVVMQLCLAWCLYRTPMPAHPLEALVAYTAVCFAFLGMGLMIAMLAGAVPAVQALGQAIFLPMIMIGGVGVPLRALPGWAQHVAGYLPGRYAVEALDACYLPDGRGLGGARFALGALVVIGTAACVAGGRMFRWDAGQRVRAGAKGWVVMALAAWAAVGVYAERTGRLDVALDAKAEVSSAAAANGKAERWQEVTEGEIDAVSYDGLPPDDGEVAPLAASLDGLTGSSKARVAMIEGRLRHWGPAEHGESDERVREELSEAGVFDVLEDADEGALGLMIINHIREQYPAGDLKRILTFIIENPKAGSVETDVAGLGVRGQITEDAARERTVMYAKKLLKRLVGK
jgi:ABC-2 type transport system permease protein